MKKYRMTDTDLLDWVQAMGDDLCRSFKKNGDIYWHFGKGEGNTPREAIRNALKKRPASRRPS